MRDIIISIVILAAAAALIYWRVTAKQKRKEEKIEENTALEVQHDVVVRANGTENSPLVASDRQEAAEIYDAIHRAVVEKCEDARALGFNAGLNPGDYIVYVIKPDRELDSNGVYVPNFLIKNADNYDGTQWDQDPRPGHGAVWAAEYVIMDNNIPSNEWVVARYTREFETLFAAAGNGLDHILQYKNKHIPGHEGDYERDLTHINSGHPLIPPRMRSFASASEPKLECRVQYDVPVEGRL